MKDNFSTASDQYALYRPGYPDELFDYLKTVISRCENAWDCGTGNGQVAVKLSAFFENVYATDISAAQLAQAVQRTNIYYSQQAAEETHFPDERFDLIVAAQAIHWFDFDKFYAEVRRTAKHGALLVVIGYGKLLVSPVIDEAINELYHVILHPYWDSERRYVDEGYRTIPFPFTEIKTPDFANRYRWTLEQLTGYLRTWSAVKHYQKENGEDPVALILPELKRQWGNAETHEVVFPLLLRVGRIEQ